MHGATLAFAQAILLTGQLQQHVLDVTTLGNTVAMTPVCTGDVIVVTQMHAGCHRNGFLIAIHVNKARQLTLLVLFSYALFEFAYQLHQAIRLV